MQPLDPRQRAFNPACRRTPRAVTSRLAATQNYNGLMLQCGIRGRSGL